MMTRVLALFFGVLGRLTPGDQGQELLVVGREFEDLTRPAHAAPAKRR